RRRNIPSEGPQPWRPPLRAVDHRPAAPGRGATRKRKSASFCPPFPQKRSRDSAACRDGTPLRRVEPRPCQRPPRRRSRSVGGAAVILHEPQDNSDKSIKTFCFRGIYLFFIPNALTKALG